MTVPTEGSRTSAPLPKRRNRSPEDPKKLRISIAIGKSEYRQLRERALSDGVTVSAFIAGKALAKDPRTAMAASLLHETLQELNKATSQMQKAGTNFNQCVAALNATGQPPGNLPQYARYTATVIRRVDDAIAAVCHQLP
jgi:hypothetical protein